MVSFVIQLCSLKLQPPSLAPLHWIMSRNTEDAAKSTLLSSSLFKQSSKRKKKSIFTVLKILICGLECIKIYKKNGRISSTLMCTNCIIRANSLQSNTSLKASIFISTEASMAQEKKDSQMVPNLSCIDPAHTGTTLNDMKDCPRKHSNRWCFLFCGGIDVIFDQQIWI